MNQSEADDLIIRIKPIIKKIFGLNPQKVKLKVYSKNEWKINDIFVEGTDRFPEILEPKKLVASVLAEGEYAVGYIYHEYFGHGLFYELSSIGKTIASNTDDTNKMNKHVLLDKHSDLLPFRFSELFNLQFYDEADRLECDITMFSEGIAFWFERYLMLMEPETIGLWTNREQQLAELNIVCASNGGSVSWLDIYNVMDTKEKELGIPKFLKFLGF